MKPHTETDRIYYLDALRVGAILMMLVFHVNMIFVVEWGWHIKNDSQSNVLMEINYWMAFFRMPLLFFVSAYISCILLERMKTLDFVVQRFNRLMIPTLVWTFLIVAPQVYFERRLQGVEFNYIQFYKTFLEFDWYPEGNFHWLHLWFLPYLFVYNLLLIPLFYVLRRCGDIQSECWGLWITLFVAIAVLPYTFLSIEFPPTYDLVHDFGRHSFFVFFIVFGVLAFRFRGLLNFVETHRSKFFRCALASILFVNVIRWNAWEPKDLWLNWLENPLSYVFFAFLNVNSWLWLFTILGYGKRYLNRSSRVLKYCNHAAYPFYILHQSVIVVVAYYVVRTKDDAVLKYLFILFVSFILTALFYHLYIRPFKPVRFLFGAK